MHILFALMLFVLASCDSGQQQGLGGAAESEAPIAGTLADANNPVEMAAAPLVSRLALLTYNTAKDLRQQKITKDQAVDFRAREQQWRVRIESAVQSQDLAAVQAVATELEQYLEHRS